MRNWLHPSGGLLYHLKSFKHRSKNWQPFLKELHQMQWEWLKQITDSQRKNLILIGGSGGHVQSSDFLRQFSHLVHVDLDPLAAYFFKKRHAHPSIEFRNKDIFKNDREELKILLQDFSPQDSTWMWCNLLGQVGLSLSEDEFHRELKNISSVMKPYSWMSFHDLYSTKFKQNLNLPIAFKNWEEAAIHIKKLPLSKIELTDHLTKGQLKFKKSKVALWPLTSKHLHFIEVGFN